MIRFTFFLAFLLNAIFSVAQTSLVSPKYGWTQLENNILLEWNNVVNADYYQLQISLNADFSPSLSFDVFASDTTITLSPNTYFWRVRSVEDGTESSWSSIFQFKIINLNSIGTIALWLDPSVGITLESPNLVSSWSDRNGVYPNLVQATSGLKPLLNSSEINNLPAVYFDGGDQIGAASSLSAGTYFTVMKHYNNSSNAICGLVSGTANPRFMTSIVTGPVIGSYSIAFTGTGIRVNKAVTTSIPENNWLLISGSRTAAVTFANFHLSPTHSGYNRMNGLIAEKIVFSSILNASQIGLVEDYLRYKYSPPVNLGKDLTVDYGFCSQTLSAGPNFVSYLWSDGSTGSSISVNETGTYWVQTVDLFGFQTSDTIQVKFNSIEYPSQTLFCPDSFVEWNTGLGSDYQYEWSNSESSEVLSVTESGDYWVQITDTNGCIKTSEIVNFVIDTYPSTVSLGQDLSLCSGNLIQLTSGISGTISYLWPDGSSGSQYAVDTTGIYFVETTNINGCIGRDTVYVTISGTAPQASINVDNSCFGEITSIADASVVSNGDPVVIWDWDLVDSNYDIGETVNHIYDSPGIYQLILYVESAGGCGDYAFATVQVYENPSASFTVNNTCFNQTTAFASTSTNGSAEVNAWLWNFGQPSSGMGNTSVLPSPMRNYNELGTFNVSLLVTDMNGCSDEVTVPVTILESPIAQFTAGAICAGSPIPFTNTSSVTAPLFIQDYLWNFGDNTYSPMPLPNKTFNTIGFHTIGLTVTASNGCTDLVQVQQFTHAYPVPNFTNGPACVGTWTTLTNTSTVETGTVASSSWEINLTNNLTGSPTAFVFTNPGPNNIKLTTTSDFGCTKDTMKIISVNPALNAVFTTSPAVVIAGDPVIFTNATVGATAGGWDFGDGNTSTDLEPIHSYGPEWIDSVMTVEYIVSNTIGCTDTAYTTIPVYKARFDLAVQNIFLDEDNGYYNIGVNLRNMGTSMVEYADVELRLSNGTVLKDRYEQNIQGGQTVVMVFSAQPSAFLSDQDGTEAWICAEAKASHAGGLEDEDPTNDRFCKNIEGEGPVLIGPNPNPATDQFTFDLIITTESTITVDLTDSRGRIVRRYFNESTLPKGLYTITETILGMESGVYFLRWSSGEMSEVRKVVVR